MLQDARSNRSFDSGLPDSSSTTSSTSPPGQPLVPGPGPDTDPAQVHRKSSSLDNVNLQVMIIMMIVMIMMIMMSTCRARTSSKLTGGRASVCSGGWRRPLRRRWRLTEVLITEVMVKEVREVLITSR